MLKQRDHRCFKAKSGFWPFVDDQQFAVAYFGAEGNWQDTSDILAFWRFKGAGTPEMSRPEEVLAVHDGEAPQVAVPGQAVCVIQRLNESWPVAVWRRPCLAGTSLKEFFHSRVERPP